MFGRNNLPNTSDFAVVPLNPEPQRKRSIVRLYFIGTRVLRDNKPPILMIAQRPYQMPQIGEYIEVDDLVAKEIAMRLLWHERDNPTPIPGVTTDAKIAEAVKAAYERGDSDALDVRAMVSANALQDVDEAALLKELQRRGHNVAALLAKEESATESDQAPAPTAPAAPPSGGRKTKKNQPGE
jgi:hypothetical protein